MRKPDGEVIAELICELEAALEVIDAVQYDIDEGCGSVEPQTQEMLTSVGDSLRAIVAPMAVAR